MKNEQSDKPGRDQRLEISLDGSHACALWGANLHDGEAVFVKIEGWPNASHKQEQAAMREAYELLCKAIGDRLPFDIVRDHLKPSVALPESQERIYMDTEQGMIGGERRAGTDRRTPRSTRGAWTYWLIERNSKHKAMPPNEKVMWFKERKRFAQGDKDIWTPHADKARHFKTQQEAGKYVKDNLTGGDYDPTPDVTEHLDCDGPAPLSIDPVRLAAQALLDFMGKVVGSDENCQVEIKATDIGADGMPERLNALRVALATVPSASGALPK